MFKKGDLLMFETGSYSSTAYAGPFRILKDFNRREAVDAFNAVFNTPARADERHFVAWLARERYIEDVDTSRWYLGDYGFKPLDYDETEPDRDWLRIHSEGIPWNGSFKLTEEAETRKKAEAERYATQERRERDEWKAAHPELAHLADMTTGLPSKPIGNV